MRAASPRIAVCFFGITRSLRFTFPTIRDNVLTPARAAGEARIFAHFFEQDTIENPRTGEYVTVDPKEYLLLAPDELRLEPSECCLEQWDFGRLANYADVWNDGHKTTRNLVHQLHSLHCVTAMASDWNPDLYVFVRPDLRYHDSLAPILSRAWNGPDETAWIPLWLSCGGHNDRFAVIRGGRVARKYGMRASRALDYCAGVNGPVHAERLLAFALEGERVRRIATRATRIRANGVEWWESFSFTGIENLHARLERTSTPSILKRVGHRGLRAVQQVAELPFPR